MIDQYGYPPGMLDELLFASLLLMSPEDPPAPDPAAIFAARCALCHVLGDRGSSFGPELSDAGLRLTREQIIESVEHPSRTITVGHEYVELSLKDGRKEYGVLAPESAGKVLLRQPGGITKRFAKDEVASRNPLPVSGMTLFTEKLTPAELDAVADWLLEWKIPVTREAPRQPSKEPRGVPSWFVIGAGAASAAIAAFAFAMKKRSADAAS